MSRLTPRTRQSSASKQRTSVENTNSIESVEDGEIIEKDDRSKRRKIDTVDMVDTQEEINGYLTKLRIVFDQMETPNEVEYTTPMSEACLCRPNGQGNDEHRTRHERKTKIV